jgi:TonB family protein
MKIITLIILLFQFSNSLLSQEKKEPISFHEIMPLFNGATNDEDSQQKTILFFSGRTAEEKVDSEGTVFIRFTIDTTGTATDSKVLHSTNSELNEFAIKYINEMPNWTPGMRGNKKVKV